MRETVLRRGETETLVIVTTEHGTELLDAEDELLESYLEDHHAQLLARFLANGWAIEEDGP
jgi:membrane-anchored protein YejM (alkaline phosphatase superfamily)